MVLSDVNNDPEAIAAAAEYFGVRDRVAHIVHLGLEYDQSQPFWQKLSPLFSKTTAHEDLPGLSRLVSETRMTPNKGGPLQIWLRTAFRKHFSAIPETIEIVGNSAAMRAIAEHKAGRTKFGSIDDISE
jgi:hypothetical protein